MKSSRIWPIRLIHVIGLIWLALWVLDRPANAQAVRFDSVADTTSASCASGKQCPLNVLPGTQVNFCSGQNAGVVNTSGKTVTWVSGQVFSTSWTGQISINGTSQQIASVASTTSLTLVASVGTLTNVVYSSLSACLAAPATTYTDFSAGTPCATTAQLTPQTGGACLSTADAQGGFGGWFLPGQYSYYLRVPATAGGGTYGPYPINVGASAGCPLGVTCDQIYQTLAAACTAAGAGTLYITKTWSGLTTQTLACNIYAQANGIIKPASGQTITLSRSFNGELTQHFDLSAGGGAIVNLSGPTTVRRVEWWGAKADFVLPLTVNTDSGTAIINALKQGGTVQFAKGNYYSSISIGTTVASTTMQGMGNGDVDCTTAATCLVFAAGQSGLTGGGSASDWTIRDMTLFSLSSGSSSGKHGISPTTGPVYVTRVSVIGFPANGFNALNVNVDHSRFEDDLFYLNFGDGWHCSSTDCNGMTISGTRAYNNGGWGFYADNNATNVFSNTDATHNAGGAYYQNGTSNTYILPYTEGGTGSTFTLDTGSSWNTIIFGRFGHAATITNSGGITNQIIEGPFTGNPVTGFRMGLIPSSSGGEVQVVNNAGTVISGCGPGGSDACVQDGSAIFNGSSFSQLAPTNQAFECTGVGAPNSNCTGASASNAIVLYLVDAKGNAITPGDMVSVLFHLSGHTIHAGGSPSVPTIKVNGNSALPFVSFFNAGSTIGTAYAATAPVCFMKNNSTGNYVACNQ